ncbi:secretion-regulating guanine nucleotide exchange factor [Clonorchis sinensis]|uniref:Secretion-regulating guanine nucleotide exchange factor n=1 Tax=Clonorchis sinensis TaxID=79923 RepID=G7Y405_CLOSI|nr:secretion-regulating guanine nucleotide exchange factor [Clonorchis sinensis]
MGVDGIEAPVLNTGVMLSKVIMMHGFTDASETLMVSSGFNGFLMRYFNPGKNPAPSTEMSLLFSVPPEYRKARTTCDKSLEEIMKSLGIVGVMRLPECDPRDPTYAWLETLQEMAADRCRWLSCYKGYVLVFGDLRYFHGPQAVDEPRAAGESRFLSFSRHLFGDRPVVQVASGWSHIVGRTDTGAVYTWGRADLGQLGRPNYPSIDSVGPRHDPTPGLVVFDDGENGRPVKIVDVAAGSEHSMALDENGRIWTWGWNEHGMCGILSVTDSDESGDHPLHGCLQRPTCVTFPSSNTYQSLRDPKAIAIGAGYGHSLAFVR